MNESDGWTMDGDKKSGDATHRQKKNGIKMPNDALPTNQFVRYLRESTHIGFANPKFLVQKASGDF